MFNKYIALAFALILSGCGNKEPQIARWHYNARTFLPTPATDWGGKLAIKNNCLIIETPMFGDNILVLPYDQSKSSDPEKRYYWDSQKQVLVNGKDTYKLGDFVYIFGDHIPNKKNLFSMSPDATLPECGISEITVAFDVYKEPGSLGTPNIPDAGLPPKDPKYRNQ